MSRGKEFVKNTIILFIGKFSTQFATFLLIPLFTHYLLTDDYGYVDLLQTYVSLLVPILTFRMDSALFRFLLDCRNDKKNQSKIVTNVLFVLMVGVLSSILLLIVLKFFIDFKYFKYLIINVIIVMVSNILLQLLRGIGKTKEYSISCVISSIITLLLNIILIVFYNFNASSIFISSSIANLFVVIYIIIITKVYNFFNIKMINKEIIKRLLCYSIPMIPNSLSWWIVNISDRTIISFFIGTAMNGIYSISCKFSNLLNNVFTIFNMSWQEMVSLHIKDSDSDNFISDMLMKIFLFFASITILIDAFLPVFYNVLIGESYLISYDYIPILIFANSWNVMISLIGGIYIGLKKTKEIAYTTIISAIINIIINLLFISKLGLYAASFSTLIAYVSMSIYRYYDVKKYIKLNINFNSIIIYIAVFLLNSLFYYCNNMYFNIINILMALAYFFVVNKNFMFIAFQKIKKKL